MIDGPEIDCEVNVGNNIRIFRVDLARRDFQTLWTSVRILPATFSAKSLMHSSSLHFNGSSLSHSRDFSWIAEVASVDLTRRGINWCKVFNGALSLFSLCFRFNSVFFERSEWSDRFRLPLLTRLSWTILKGCLEGVTSPPTCCVYLMHNNQSPLQCILPRSQPR